MFVCLSVYRDSDNFATCHSMSAPLNISKWRQNRMKKSEQSGFPTPKKILSKYPLKGVDDEYVSPIQKNRPRGGSIPEGKW